MSLVDINQSTDDLELPALETPAETELPKEEIAQDVVDINIVGATKQKFRINGNDSKILELNISDMGIFDRLKTGYDVLIKSMEDVKNVDETQEDFIEILKKIDKDMREQLDYIFDSNVSEVCCGKGGTMYDPINGVFRWEHILDALTNLYSNNINQEYKKMRAKVQKHTDKYVGDHQKSTSKGNTKSKRK